MPFISGNTAGGSGALKATLRKVTAKQVAGTVAATDLLNAEITVPGNTLGATGVVVMDLWGDWKQNSGGAAAGPVLQFKFGATTLFNVPTAASMLAIADSATRYGWAYRVTLSNVNATNSQTAAISGFISYLSSSATAAIAQPVTTGEGVHAATNTTSVAALEYLCLYNTAAIDTTAAVAVTFTTTNGSASASYDMTLRGALAAIF